MSIQIASPECEPDDSNGPSLETARGLFTAGDYGGAINALLPHAEHDKEAARLMGECLQKLGLDGKAEHYFAIAGSGTKAGLSGQPESRKEFIAGAMAKLEQSLTEDREIWQSLSSR